MKVVGGGVKEYPAYKVLSHVNETEDIASLKEMNWSTDEGKILFLTGHTSAIEVDIAEPLSEEEAVQAIDEYNEYYGLNKNPSAVSLGSLGGKARAKKLSKEKRVEIAKKAIKARWQKKQVE